MKKIFFVISLLAITVVGYSQEYSKDWLKSQLDSIETVYPGVFSRYMDGTMTDAEENALDEIFNKLPSARERMRALIPNANITSRGYTEEARSAGFGTRKGDTDYYPGWKRKKTWKDKIKFWKKN